ncbi:MAG: flagellar export chaperone FlgN [Desulfobacterales bacterium]|nr:flagellar export chaperone FlgN [Desulfobacterales bacterium]MBF0396194.1 flagellar export chaperone FlgN [Desulfobacterales bacterium]
MEEDTAKLETLFQDKILLYRDLLEVLKEEKNCLIDANVDLLWQISSKKQSLISKIEAVKQEIMNYVPEVELSGRLSIFNIALINIKNEVHNLAKANKSFVEDYLSFLDEIIGAITNVSNIKPNYNNRKYMTQKKQTNMLLHMEV